MAAMVAGAAFAASAGATAQWKIDAANLDGNGEFSAVKLSTDRNDNDFLSFSFTGEKAGASFGLRTNGATDFAVKLNAFSIWFQPIDQLKVTVGSVQLALPGEDFAGWTSNTTLGYKTGGTGFELDFFVGDLSLGVLLGYKDSDWNGYDYAITQNGVRMIDSKIAYSLGNAGTVGVLFGYSADGHLVNADYGTNAMRVAAGYDSGNLIENLTFRLNGIYAFGASAQKAFVEGEVAYVNNALTAKAFVPVTITLGDSATVAIGTDLYLGYGINRNTIYLTVKEADWTASDFAIEFIPGISGPCGDLNWSVEFDAKIATADSNPFTFSVPVGFSISF